MSKNELQVGDCFSVFIARRSGSGNLISRRSNKYHILETEDSSPKPNQRWRVAVSNISDNRIYELIPIEQQELRKWDAVDAPEGNGSNPFKKQ
jgi:hypothetical protein